jgi:hypothetical protein
MDHSKVLVCGGLRDDLLREVQLVGFTKDGTFHKVPGHFEFGGYGSTDVEELLGFMDSSGFQLDVIGKEEGKGTVEGCLTVEGNG